MKNRDCSADDDNEEALVVVVVALGMGGFKGSILSVVGSDSQIQKFHSLVPPSLSSSTDPTRLCLLANLKWSVHSLALLGSESPAQVSTLEEREREKETEKRMVGSGCNRKWRSRREREREERAAKVSPIRLKLNATSLRTQRSK